MLVKKTPVKKIPMKKLPVKKTPVKEMSVRVALKAKHDTKKLIMEFKEISAVCSS
jgi:hypothetical protein